MNAIPLINNAPKFRPEVNVNVNHIGGQSFNPVSPQMGNVMRQNPYGNETQLRQEVNTSIVALKREAFSLENLIAQAAQTLQDINKRLSELEGKQGDYVKKADATVGSVGGDGKYISAISETDGKINATATDLGNMVPVNSVTSGNMHSVTSNAVNVRCNAIGEWFTLILRTSVPSTATNKTLAYDRKISDYVLILFTIGNSSSNTRESILIPASQLTVNATVYGFCYVGGVLKEVDIQVISDTVIQVNGDDVLNFGMYGIMKR